MYRGTHAHFTDTWCVTSRNMVQLVTSLIHVTSHVPSCLVELIGHELSGERHLSPMLNRSSWRCQTVRKVVNLPSRDMLLSKGDRKLFTLTQQGIWHLYNQQNK
eukprot:sb/3478033/